MAERFPLGYPEGWYQVAYADDLAPRAVLALEYFGRKLVAFRTESGRPQVLDAHCAHLGAHLGVGGQITGECLRCPFHAWTYDVAGECVAIPYSERVPRGARVESYPTLERSGIVYLWFSPMGRAPGYEPPTLDEHGHPDWVGYHRYRYRFSSIVQEVLENVFDVPHGQFVHGNAQGSAPATVTFRFDGHQAEALFELDMPLVGGKTTHRTTTYGPAINVNRSTGHGTKSFVTTYTPIDAETLEANFSFMTPRATPDDPTGERSLASARATVALFEQDIPIWEHKVYRPVPLLCDGDAMLSRYRVWMRQFYDEG